MITFNAVPIDANLADCYNNSPSNGLLIERRRDFLQNTFVDGIRAKSKNELSILIGSYETAKRLSMATVW